MKIIDLLPTTQIVTNVHANSKKRVLEILASTMAQANSKLSELEISSQLLARERLGSTALGRGVAIPHSRLQGLEVAIGALIKLDQGIDFDAPDQQPVDLIFGLAVPESCADEHLQLLAVAAQLFSDDRVTCEIRNADTSDHVLQVIRHWKQAHAA